jgi:hypothetical protein
MVVGWISAVHTRWHAPGGKGLMVRRAALGMLVIMVVVAVVTDQTDVNTHQQGEDEGLDEADKQFEEVERNRKSPFAHAGHGVEEIFAAKYVAEQTEGK